jgi:hypothetical protein
VLHRSSCADMPSPLSRRTDRVRSSLASPTIAAFPEILIGSASALVFSRPAQRSHSLWPVSSQIAQGDPLHRRLQPLRYLHGCSDCYRLERQLPGGTHPRWKTVPWHGAQNQALRGRRASGTASVRKFRRAVSVAEHGFAAGERATMGNCQSGWFRPIPPIGAVRASAARELCSCTALLLRLRVAPRLYVARLAP